MGIRPLTASIARQLPPCSIIAHFIENVYIFYKFLYDSCFFSTYPYTSYLNIPLNLSLMELNNLKLDYEYLLNSNSKKTIGNPLFSKNRSKNSLLEQIISDKTKILKSTITELLSEITQRELINNDISDKIDQEIFSQKNNLQILRQKGFGYAFDNLLTRQRLESQLEDSIQDLEQEKRKERVECWRDLMNLKKDLLSAFREYWNLAKRRELLEL